jgi:hypothetical protein
MIVFNSTLNAASEPFLFDVQHIRDELAERLDIAFREFPSTSIWFVPGAQAEDREMARAPSNWPTHHFVSDEYRPTAINLAETMIFHAPTVGTYSTWMIPGIDHPDFRRPE